MADRDETLLSKALDQVGHDARDLLLDSLACVLHNDGYYLDGNTETSDIDWFADMLYRGMHGASMRHLPADDQEVYRRQAVEALRTLPLLMDRIASRCQVQSRAIRSLLDYERRERRARDTARQIPGPPAPPRNTRPRPVGNCCGKGAC